MLHMKERKVMKAGQAAIEYMLALAALVVVVFMTFHLIHVTKKAASRTVNIVSSDYP